MSTEAEGDNFSSPDSGISTDKGTFVSTNGDEASQYRHCPGRTVRVSARWTNRGLGVQRAQWVTRKEAQPGPEPANFPCDPGQVNRLQFPHQQNGARGPAPKVNSLSSLSFSAQQTKRKHFRLLSKMTDHDEGNVSEK